MAAGETPVSLVGFTLPVLTPDETDVATMVLLFGGLVLCFFAFKVGKAVIVAIGGLVFGLFCFNQLTNLFGGNDLLVFVAGAWVSVIGAIVGGTLALLVSQIATSACLGSLLAISMLLFDAGTMVKRELDVAIVFGVLISLVIIILWNKEELAMILMTAVFGGLLVTCGVDLISFNGGIVYNISPILQMSWPAGMVKCDEGCCTPELLVLWTMLSVLGILVQSNIMGLLNFQGLCCKGRQAYTRVTSFSAFPLGGSAGGGAGGVVGSVHLHPGPNGGYGGVGSRDKIGGFRRTWTYSDNHEFNYFDDDNLPPALEKNKEMICNAAEILANMFGFQDDSVRNQVEHALTLLANHRRYTSETPAMVLGEAVLPPQSAVHSLHQKLFSNYCDWCEAMRVAPHFMQATLPDGGSFGKSYGGSDKADEEALVVDLMLWLCLWGEAGNIRHMPECLCFLYHKMMQEYMSLMKADCPSLYGGFFLDHVVTPIYEVVTKKAKQRAGDHVKTLNYDDFNEFFWTPACLKYSYRSDDVHGDDSSAVEAGLNNLSAGHGDSSASVIPVVKAMETTPKTFLEKRSLFSTLLSFHRIMEFHLVTFQVLTVWSFSERMVWDRPYTLQMMSTVFWTFNFLGIVWTILEVWQAFPGIQMTGTARCGFLVRLSGRYLILVYQTIYLMWSIDSTGAGVGMQSEGSQVFWWWQYLWLSVVVMVPYVVEVLQQVFPPLSSWMCTRDSDYLQAFLNICYPLSRIYVAKRVHEPFHKALSYMFYWGTMITFKLWFSLKYEVVILVLPTTELYDDYINYPGQSFWAMFFLIFARWIPQVCIYFIDTSIWFACWSAMAGSIVGFQERLGEVRDFPSIRTHFMRMPSMFCSKVICPGVSSRDSSMLDMDMEHTEDDINDVISGGMRQNNIITQQTLTEASRLLGQPHKGGSRPALVREYVSEFLDVRTQKWATFAAVWNEVINKMRDSDVISNSEQAILKFHSFSGFAKPVYLPIFQTAGSMELAVSIIQEEVDAFEMEEDLDKKDTHEQNLRKRISEDVTVKEALSEVWELGMWLLRQMVGPAHDTDMARIMQVFSELINSDNAMCHLRLGKMKAIVHDTTAIIQILYSSLPKRAHSSSASVHSAGSAPEQGKARADGSRSNGTVKRRTGVGSLKKSISTSGLSEMGVGNTGSPMPRDGVSGGLATEGRRAGMLGAHVGSGRVSPPDKTRDAVRDKLRPLMNAVQNMVKNIDERATEVVGRLSYMANLDSGFMWDDVYASQRLDKMAEDKKTLSIIEKMHGLLCIDRNAAEPQSVEARRRLAFFVNSLFMDMPRAPPVGEMMSWTCMTPFYNEDVVYGRDDLERKNEDGLTTLLYLQALYKHDWRNFMERNQIVDEQQSLAKRHIERTRLWASFRAQTLSRTVEGMMYYEAALRLLSHLERVNVNQVNDLVLQKFQYVVACQVYGRMKKNQDPKADDIEMLLRRFPSLRVAYIDEVRASRDTNYPDIDYYSVLIKASQIPGDNQAIQEIYRVKLPGNPVIGEGKPENQNHAIIFSRGEHLQAIDMNQEGYFEEALKMRCVLEEFRRSTSTKPTVIVGFREHIFTGSVSSLANYMALQELSFVTLGQRVLNNPLKVRMHYGHPDVFDKLFYMTNGGISKASKGINLSEDIFAGYNGAIRGGEVQFREYMQVGKGRDVGMQQIYKFEAKLAQGAAEQTLSRDVNRLGDRLDFFRLMSFYFGGLGYYIGNYVTVVTITYVVYFLLALCVFNSEEIGDRKITPEGNLQMLLAGMGILNTLPMLATIMVEKGLWAAVTEVLQVFVSGGPMYFMFHIQTRAHYFYQTLLAGGAQYRATGRGFVTHHSCFDDLYRFFANSHFYLGFELMVALVLVACLSHTKQYIGMTWSLWLACLSFLFAPFWFNPLSFHWGKVVQDYKIWWQWMSGTGGNSSNSWEVWWREENTFVSKFSLGQKLQGLIKPMIYLMIGVGIGIPKIVELDSKEIREFLKLGLLALAMLLGHCISDQCGMRFSPWVRRSSKIIIGTFAIIYGAMLMISHAKYIRVGVGLYYITSALSIVGVMLGFNGVRHAYHLHDFVLGHLLFFVLLLLSALQIPSTIQTWLLFHNALSEGVVIDDILKYARMSRDMAGVDVDDEDLDLKKIVQAQAQELETLKQRIVDAGGGVIIGYPSVNGQGGGAGAMGAGMLNNTPSGGFSFQPLAGDNYGHVQEAEMMRASTSTMDLTELAHGGSSRGGPSRDSGSASANANANTNRPFEFNSPASMPPRD